MNKLSRTVFFIEIIGINRRLWTVNSVESRRDKSEKDSVGLVAGRK